MILARSFDKEMHDRKPTLAAKLLKSIPTTRDWYFKRMKNAHQGANIPPLLEHIDREARDAALLSPFKMRGAFERFIGPDFTVSTVEKRTELLREIILQLRAGHSQFPGDATMSGGYAFDVKEKLAGQLEKASKDILEFPYLGIFTIHANVTFKSELRRLPWSGEPSLLFASEDVRRALFEVERNVCTDLSIVISTAAPDVRLDEWGSLLSRARTFSGRVLGV